MSNPVKVSLSLSQLQQDIITAARSAGVPFDEEKITEVLTVFEDQFTQTAVEFRTSTKPLSERGLSFRYVDLNHTHNPLSMALKAGLLPDDDSPMQQLLNQIADSVGLLGYGTDASVSHGLEKIWPFLDHAYPLRVFYDLPALPAAVTANDDYMQRHGLTTTSIIGVDFHNHSMNIYYPFPDVMRGERTHAPADLAAMLTDCGFERPSDEVLSYLSQSPIFNLTYSWESEDIQRFCVYVPVFSEADVPEFDPLLTRHAANVPFQTDARSFIIGYTLRRSGSDYIKIENDYDGNIMGVLQTSLMVPPVPADE